jgi:hypothetical protein
MVISSKNPFPALKAPHLVLSLKNPFPALQFNSPDGSSLEAEDVCPSLSMFV